MTHNGGRIAPDVTEGNPEIALDPDKKSRIEERLATGRVSGEARDVAEEAERVARLMANGELTMRDLVGTYPSTVRHMDGFEPEFYGDDWDGYDPLESEDDAYRFEEDGVVEVAGVRDDVPLNEGEYVEREKNGETTRQLSH